MTESIKIYKFLFKAHITTFDLKANISSPLIVNWKRSNQTATTQPVQMSGGKANINQTLNLPVNMYFDLKSQKFQQKKSQFSFTMKAPKGDKQAGVVYVDLSQQINDKVAILNKTFTLQKCPVKNSQVQIQITGQCIGQKDVDNMSQDSFMMQTTTPSTLSIQSHVTQKSSNVIQSTNITKKQITNKQDKNSKRNQNKQDQKDKKIKQLQELVSKLKQQNKKLTTQLTQQKQLSKRLSSSKSQSQIINSLKEQILKGKSIQQKLQLQIDNYRLENTQNQKELQLIRQKMDKVYENLCHQFNIQQK